MNRLLLAILLLGSAPYACSQDKQAPFPTESSTEPPQECLASLWVPGDFDFSTTRDVEVEVVVRDLDGKPRPGTIVFITDYVSDLPGLQTRIGASVTDEDGRVLLTVTLPADQSALQVVGAFMGGRNVVVVPIEGNRVFVALGG